MRAISALALAFPLIASAGLLSQPSVGERFHPSDPQFVVLERSARAPRAAAPGASADAAASTARDLIARARSEREPRFFGYAEAIIKPWLANAAQTAPELLVLQADILQNRHEFSAALATLNRAIEAQPRDARPYLQRAVVRMVGGDFAAARADCRKLITGGELAVGSVCMAQAISGTGSTERGEAMIRALLTTGQQFDSSTRAWALATLAELERRRGEDSNAESLLRQAIALSPADDAIRCALADVLLDRRAYRDALAVSSIERPSLPLLVRTATAQRQLNDAAFTRTARQYKELIELGRQRADSAHSREEALYALNVEGNARAAVALARENFKAQRETIDVRLLAQSAAAARDAAAMDELRHWLAATGYRDRIVESILRVI